MDVLVRIVAIAVAAARRLQEPDILVVADGLRWKAGAFGSITDVHGVLVKVSMCAAARHWRSQIPMKGSSPRPPASATATCRTADRGRRLRPARRARCRRRRRTRSCLMLADCVSARCSSPDQIPLRCLYPESNADAFNRDVGTRAHGDADIGGGKRRYVVHTVASHGDESAFARPPVRSGASLPSGSRRRARHRRRASWRQLGRVTSIVAGRHDDLQAALVQRADRGLQSSTDRIGDGNDAASLPSEPTNIAVLPSARSASARPASGLVSMPKSVISAGCEAR